MATATMVPHRWLMLAAAEHLPGVGVTVQVFGWTDVLIYYSFIYVLFVGTLAARAIGRIERFLHRRIGVHQLPWIGR